MFNWLRAFLQAAFYDRMMAKTERLCLGELRAELLAPLKGEVLEIGTGTGVNIPYYPDSLTRLTLSEPDPHMRRKLQQRLASSPVAHIDILSSAAEQHDLPDASFDHIVSTLVLCSVRDVGQTLREFKRLLRPGGSLVLIEHVAGEDPRLFNLQRRLEPFWKWFAGNCHLTRNTASLLEQAGFMTTLQQAEMCGAPGFVRPLIKGGGSAPGRERGDLNGCSR